MGKLDSTGSGAYHTNTSYYLIFSCYTPVVLKSVKVFANSSGNRTIVLRNSAGTVLQTLTVNIPQGQSRVTLNFSVPVGNNMQLALASGSAIGLWRSADDNISFPYTINGKISITGSNTTSLRYYFFYDWEIESPTCTSVRVPVTAHINTLAPDAGFSHTATGLNVNFTDLSQNGASWLWDFGDGSTSVVQQPSHSFPSSGTYAVKQVVINACGSDSVMQNITVDVSSAEEIPTPESWMLYPNPSGDGSVRLSGTYLTEEAVIAIYDIRGKRVAAEIILQAATGQFDLQLADGLSAGIYQVVIRHSRGIQMKKLVVAGK